MTQLAAGVVYTLLGLLVLIVITGLVRDQIDPQALAMILIPAVVGPGIGIGAKQIFRPNDPKKGDDE